MSTLNITNNGCITVTGIVQWNTYSNSATSGAIGVGYWYDGGKYRGLMIHFPFTVSAKCSSISTTLAYSRHESSYKAFYAGVSTSSSAYSTNPAEVSFTPDSVSFSFTITRATENYFVPGTTYYLCVWTNDSGSSSSFGTYSGSTPNYGTLTATFTGVVAPADGLVHISNGSSFSDYVPYIYTDSAFASYIPYIYDSTQSSWVICT